jgi:hypothetical protein
LGIDWNIVSGEHIARACPDFPLQFGQGGVGCDPPNRADQINPPGDQFIRITIQRGVSPVNANPLSFQPAHQAWVNPETGEQETIVVVPADQSWGWLEGYGQINAQMLTDLTARNDPNQPSLVLMSHDGDNAYAYSDLLFFVFVLYIVAAHGLLLWRVSSGICRRIAAAFRSRHVDASVQCLLLPDAADLTVVALRRELRSRGLRTTGLRRDLEGRLREAAAAAIFLAISACSGVIRPTSFIVSLTFSTFAASRFDTSSGAKAFSTSGPTTPVRSMIETCPATFGADLFISS